MNFTKKIDRARQWAGEKMGGEAKTTTTDDFKMLETEMALRYDGMDRLQKSMTAYIKWAGRRSDVFEDHEKGLPGSYLGRTMVGHGDDFAPDSTFGTCLAVVGRANEYVAAAQEQYVATATDAWLASLDRSLAMLKEYQAARKKLESRRLAYDTSLGKMQKARRDDFRVEEELRTQRAKYEESNEDVLRRMQDIQDAEADSVRDLSAFLACQLAFHERAVDELRRAQRAWPGGVPATPSPRPTSGANAGTNLGANLGAGLAPPTTRSRSNTARSYQEGMAIRASPRVASVGSPASSSSNYANTYANSYANTYAPEQPPRPTLSRASSAYGPSSSSAAALSPSPAPPAATVVASLRNGLRPVGRAQTHNSYLSTGSSSNDGDEPGSAGSSGGGGAGGRSTSPDWGNGSGERSTSPATSYGSLSRTSSNVAMGLRKPPPPPPSRAKKPPPPPPMKREVGY